MKVFVWKSYGDISVHAFNSEEQKKVLKEEITEALQREGSSVNTESSWFELEEEIQTQHYSDSDMFEFGTGFYKIKE